MSNVVGGRDVTLVIGHSTLFELMRGYCQSWNLLPRTLPKEKDPAVIAEALQHTQTVVIDLANADPTRAQTVLDAAATLRLPVVLLTPLVGGRSKDSIRLPANGLHTRVAKPMKRKDLLRALSQIASGQTFPPDRTPQPTSPVHSEPAAPTSSIQGWQQPSPAFSAASAGLQAPQQLGRPSTPIASMPAPFFQQESYSSAPQPMHHIPQTAAPMHAPPAYTGGYPQQTGPAALPMQGYPAPVPQMPAFGQPPMAMPGSMGPEAMAAFQQFMQQYAYGQMPQHPSLPQMPGSPVTYSTLPPSSPPAQPAFQFAQPSQPQQEYHQPVPPMAPPQPKKKAPAATDSFAAHHPANILLVDDQPLNHKIVTLFLQRLGYKEIQIANNGREGVDLVNKGNFDIVFMDLQMPVMGGVEAAREIRGNFLLKQQPAIIAMTGHALSGVKESCMEAGMNDFLTKPVSLEDFRRVIPQCLESASSHLVGTLQ